MKLKSKKKKYKVTLITEMLGTLPKDPEVYKRYIATKEDEIQAADNLPEYTEEGGWTTFARNGTGEIIIYDYMIKGFLKSACETLMANGAIKKIPAYKKWFDRLVFVWPRQIPTGKMEPDSIVERPLRAMTAQGPRVTVTRSDALGVGTEFEFEVELLENDKKITWEVIEQCLAYGRYVAFGQWRGSGGYGRAEFVEVKVQ